MDCDKFASSGFALIAAPTKLPDLTRWIAVWDIGCGPSVQFRLRGSNTAEEILRRGGSLDDYNCYRVQPADPT